MSFTPQLKFNSDKPVEDVIPALVNMVNFLLREMTAGRVFNGQEQITQTSNVLRAQMGGNITEQIAEQQRKALQMFAASLSDEQAMEVATVFDPWKEGKAYKVGEFITYGVNSVGDPQLYKITQVHTSQADWPPDQTASLYTAIGLDDSGYPIWSPPTGAHDAYNIGDIVNYNGVLYKSLIDGNITVPGSDERYWEIYEEVQ